MDAEILSAGGDFLINGCNSFLNPSKLGEGFYADGMNVINRGGIVQTRPGTNTLYPLPDGIPQGMTFFQPTSGIPQQVVAVGGSVYVSQAPFSSYFKLPNVAFNPQAKFVTWAVCLKSTYYDPAGTLLFLDKPYTVLVMQDGLSRAAYWDGVNNGHLNPNTSPDFPITKEGYDETPVGLWMKWSNNRLWLSRGNQIFASDIGNPLKFTEAQYLNEGRAFYLPDDCTGIAVTSDQQGIICFTANTGTFLRSSIQDRTLWLQTTDFQLTILPNIGCVSGRSITNQYGLIWWYSTKGLMNLDNALSSNITSRIAVQDNQMFSTKEGVSYDLSGVCSSFYENFLLVSVPWGDSLNRRTIVLDQAPSDGAGVAVSNPFTNPNTNAWASFWTGWRPVEWARSLVDGQERLFFLSADYDGKNRVWEAFNTTQLDNGVPITCYAVTKDHNFGNADYKRFSYAEIEMIQLSGEVSVMIGVAGTRGAYQAIAKKEIVATNGQVYSDQLYGDAAHDFAGSRGQYRLIKTQDTPGTSECNAACVETNISGLEDKAFSILVAWSGIGAVSSYRMFIRQIPNTYTGDCEVNESGPNLISDEGCGAKDLFSTSAPFPSYSSSFTATVINSHTGASATVTAASESFISQDDADRIAMDAATVQAGTRVGVN